MNNNKLQTSTLTLYKVLHRKKTQLLVTFPYDYTIKNKLKHDLGYLWSVNHRGWYVLFSEDAVEVLKKHLGTSVNFILDKSLETSIAQKSIKKNRTISEEHKKIIRSYIKYLKGKRYSESTVKTYFTFIADFFEYLNDKPACEFSNRDIELFIEDVFVPKNMSISSQRQLISALKLFKAFYPNCKIEALTLQRPRKSKILPTVLSKEEIIDLLRYTKNLKHRAILAIIYSAGLRIGELLTLELKNIDFDRRQIVVKNGKGNEGKGGRGEGGRGLV